MMKKRWIMIGLTFFAQSVLADITYLGNPSVSKKPDEGRAKVSPYDAATGNTNELDDADRRFISQVTSTYTIGGWYSKLRLGYPNLELRNFQNTRTTEPPTENTVEGHQFMPSLNIGYQGQFLAGEMELYTTDKLLVPIDPLINDANSENFRGQTNVMGLAFNTIYYVPQLFRWQPFRLRPILFAGFGFARKRNEARLVDPITDAIEETNSNSDNGLMFQYGAGVSWQFTRNFGMELIVRKQEFGTARFGVLENNGTGTPLPATPAVTGADIKATDLTITGMTIGLVGYF